jgi:hypothetical protein
LCGPEAREGDKGRFLQNELEKVHFQIKFEDSVMQSDEKLPKMCQDFIKMKDMLGVLGQDDALATGSPVFRVVPQISRIHPNPSAGEVRKVRYGFRPRIDDEVFRLSKKGLLKTIHALESPLILAT